MRGRAFLLGLLLLMTAPVGADERLAMRVFPEVSFAPANLIIRARIEANAENRLVKIVAESDDFYRASEVEIDGDKAPRTNVFEFRSLPSGSYQVTATLLDASGRQRAYVRSLVKVIASGGEPGD